MEDADVGSEEFAQGLYNRGTFHFLISKLRIRSDPVHERSRPRVNSWILGLAAPFFVT